MNAGNFVFGGCSVIVLFGALWAVSARRPMRGALGLLFVALGLAGLFLKLNAQFLAFAALLLSVSAVTVLFVGLTSVSPRESQPGQTGAKVELSRIAAAGGFAAFVLVGMGLSLSGAEGTRLRPAPLELGAAEHLGGQLFTDAYPLFALLLLLLVVAALAVLSLGRRTAPVPETLPPDQPKSWFSGPVVAHKKDVASP